MVSSGSQDLDVLAAVLGTGEITVGMNAVAWVIGALSLAVGVASKQLPQSKFMFTESWTLEHEMSVKEKAYEFAVSLCQKNEEESNDYE
jgi:hypothetical protein